jgi:hypothetical protein
LPVISLDASAFCKFTNHICVNWVNGFEALENTLCVIVSCVLFSRSSYAIVMLDDSNNIKHGFFSCKHGLNLFVGSGLVD